eukprot:TRINITY_DN17006_c0_g1_i1.p1 TRINITY_DN17006_c0_g1~~TRINITY_DN17006_c0_g1_i1.p1  ORF type:complete len:216 (+),score=28.02 TRINITY_DN17006_c0_g1_i1:151-798(+)
MAVNLGFDGGAPSIDGGAAGAGGGGAGNAAAAAADQLKLIGARAFALAQGAGDNLPGSVKAIPGDPLIARRVGTAAGGLLALISFLALLGGIHLEEVAVAYLADAYGLAMAAVTLLIEAEFPQVAAARDIVVSQARFLGTPLGVGGLQLAQGLLALSQGTVGHVLAGLLALVAGGLDLFLWHQRPQMPDADGSSGLITGQSSPYPDASPTNDMNY